MIDVIGVDKGSIITNTSKGYELLSTVRYLDDDEINLDKSKTVVEFRGKKLVIGESGNFASDLMKADQENTPAVVYTAIAKSIQDEHIETNLVLDLPIRLYAKNKEKMASLFNKQTETLTVNGATKIINIKKAIVFPEAAAAFNNQTKKDALVFDFGGLSVDVAQFRKGKLIKYSTYKLGLLTLYLKIANKLNSEFDLSIKDWEVKETLEEGVYIDGSRVDLGIEPIIKSHIKEIMNSLKLEYDLKRERNIILTGGGSKDYFDYLKVYMPQGELSPHAKADNALGLEKIGRKVFKV